MVERSLPVRDIAELIAYAKANPGKLSFGSSGPNTTHHLAGELFKAQAGIDMIHVPYRGGNPAMTDLLAGQIRFCSRRSRPPRRISTAAASGCSA